MRAKHEEKFRIRNGAFVSQDFHQASWTDDGTVFTRVAQTADRSQVEAYGFGILNAGGEAYGSGALYVDNKDLIPLDSPDGLSQAVDEYEKAFPPAPRFFEFVRLASKALNIGPEKAPEMVESLFSEIKQLKNLPKDSPKPKPVHIPSTEEKIKEMERRLANLKRFAENSHEDEADIILKIVEGECRNPFETVTPSPSAEPISAEQEKLNELSKRISRMHSFASGCHMSMRRTINEIAYGR